MLKIKLFCAAGMSTSLLEREMKKAAAASGVEVEIESFPITELERQVYGCDVILLGPQLSYMRSKAKAAAAKAGIPLDVINMADFGRCNGAKVLQTAVALSQPAS